MQNLYQSRKFNNRQQKQIKYSKIIQNLYIARQSLSREIYNSFDTLKKTKTKSSSLYIEYLRIQYLFVTTIYIEERSLLKAMQQKYNRQILINNIKQQLSNATISTDVLLIIYKQT